MKNINDEMLSGVTGGGTLKLPSAEFPENEYDSMFNGNSGFEGVPDLPANTLAEKTYKGMSIGSDPLKSSPEMPAIRLPDGEVIK